MALRAVTMKEMTCRVRRSMSVLYHALQAAKTCSQYQQDAQAEGATEVADFMREVQEQNTRIAQQAKELLLKQQQI
jgi:hypothetical protein